MKRKFLTLNYEDLDAERMVSPHNISLPKSVKPDPFGRKTEFFRREIRQKKLLLNEKGKEIEPARDMPGQAPNLTRN